VKIVRLDQNTSDWLAWRTGGVGASDAPIVLGVSPWKTREELLAEKRASLGRARPGRYEKPMSAMMARGKELEPEAVAWYAGLTGIVTGPLCCHHDEHEWIKASLDGWSESPRRILEVKCPGRSAHDSALAGEVPDYYVPQLVHQALVTGCGRIDYVSYDPRRRRRLDRFALVARRVTPAEVAFLLDRLVEFWGEVTAR
jgi:putative phage-type endonuclease